MAEFAEEQKIGYPIAIDVEDRTTGAFAVDSYPDYTLIDRSGKLRVADLANADLERAVQVLLAEKAPPAGPLAEAGERAKKKDKRLLVVWGSEAERAPVDAALKKDRDLSKLVRNEYEVVRLARAEHGELAGKHTAGEAGLFLAVLDPAGKRLASIAEGTLLAEGSLNVGAFREFLEKHRVPVRDAEKIWRAALARAEQENKRLLVHLGAPW